MKPSPPTITWDVVIVGAGPAGLSAALVLGRCCRRVLVCDSNEPRNWASHAVHGFLTRDGVNPRKLLRTAQQDLTRYPNVAFHQAKVTSIEPFEDGFHVQVGPGTEVCRKVLLSTGIIDELPPIAGIEPYFGISVFQCPYCDGWENRDLPTAVYGRGRRGFSLARTLTPWARQLVLCTDGPAKYSIEQRLQLSSNGIEVEERKILGIFGKNGKMEFLELEGGAKLLAQALFFNMPTRQHSALAARLGCTFSQRGGVNRDDHAATDVPGVYAAGNLIKDVGLAIVAAADGARAAFGINQDLTNEDFERHSVQVALRSEAS